MAKKGDELIAYVTRRVVTRMLTPEEERMAAKRAHRTREPFLTRWFGMVPMAIGLMVKPREEEEPAIRTNAETIGQGQG